MEALGLDIQYTGDAFAAEEKVSAMLVMWFWTPGYEGCPWQL